MEIQKIFSDEFDDERYYSVLMNEEELVLFSEIQKEFGFNFGSVGKKLGIGLSSRQQAAKSLKQMRSNTNNLVKSGKMNINDRNFQHMKSVDNVRKSHGLPELTKGNNMYYNSNWF